MSELTEEQNRIISFAAHPCALLAIRPGESREAIGALHKT